MRGLKVSSWFVCWTLMAALGTPVLSAQEIYLNQPPTGTPCGNAQLGEQSLAEDFEVLSSTEIGFIQFWGGYSPGDTPGTDDFTVRLLEANGDVPGTLISEAQISSMDRRSTGRPLFGFSEYSYSLTIEPPLQVDAAGVYFIEVYNNPTGTADTFCLEGGRTDPVAGIDGSVFSFTTPGATWIRTPPGNGMVLAAPGTIFFDGFETGDLLGWSP